MRPPASAREKYTHSPSGRLHAGVSGGPPAASPAPTSRIDPRVSLAFSSRSSQPAWVGQLTATVDPSGPSAGRAMEAMLPSITTLLSARVPCRDPRRTGCIERPHLHAIAPAPLGEVHQETIAGLRSQFDPGDIGEAGLLAARQRERPQVEGCPRSPTSRTAWRRPARRRDPVRWPACSRAALPRRSRRRPPRSRCRACRRARRPGGTRPATTPAARPFPRPPSAAEPSRPPGSSPRSSRGKRTATRVPSGEGAGSMGPLVSVGIS